MEKLKVSFQMLREFQDNYQNAIKTAQKKYFTEAKFTKSSSKPQVLFNIVNSAFNPTY